MTTSDEIENRLRIAFDVAPAADAWDVVDKRLARAMASPRAAQQGRTVLRPLFLRPLIVLAAFLLLTGAVGAALNLLDRTVESSGTPGWQTAWDRATQLGIQETDAGIIITLERAYADLNQVLVGFTVAGLDAQESFNGQAGVEWVVELRDPDGRVAEEWARSQTGMGLDETDLSAVIQTWEGDVTPTAGTWVLTFSSVGYDGDGFVPGQCTVGATDPECVDPASNVMVDGTWRFAFELPAPAGRIVAPSAADTAGPATLELTELRVTPTAVIARIGLLVDGSSVATWSSDAVEIRHRDVPYDVRSNAAIFAGELAEGTGQTVFLTTAGSDGPAGTWVIEIHEIRFQARDGSASQLNGPWTLTVDVP
jgi:hypothetical protein